MSKYYRVSVESTSRYDVVIKAPDECSEDDVWDYASELDGGEFDLIDEGGWHMYALDLVDGKDIDSTNVCDMTGESDEN